MLMTIAILLALQAIGHSLLGETTMIRPLLQGEVPALLGSERFAKDTLRTAWHATSIAWLTQAGVIFWIALAETPDASQLTILRGIGCGLALSGVWFLLATRARHLVWLLHLTAAAVCLLH